MNDSPEEENAGPADPNIEEHSMTDDTDADNHHNMDAE